MAIGKKKEKPLKIAISGAVSTGKTTLGKALAEALGSAFIEENLQPIFILPEDEKNDSVKRAKRVAHVLESKKKREEEQEAFVVDRSPADILNFWFGLMLHTQIDSTKIVERCAEYLATYDHVILLPFGVIEVKQKEDVPEPQRNMNKWNQLLGSVRIHGFAHQFVPREKLIELPKDIVGEKERLEFVLKCIG